MNNKGWIDGINKILMQILAYNNHTRCFIATVYHLLPFLPNNLTPSTSQHCPVPYPYRPWALPSPWPTTSYPPRAGGPIFITHLLTAPTRPGSCGAHCSIGKDAYETRSQPQCANGSGGPGFYKYHHITPMKKSLCHSLNGGPIFLPLTFQNTIT